MASGVSVQLQKGAGVWADKSGTSVHVPPFASLRASGTRPESLPLFLLPLGGKYEASERHCVY